MRPGGKSNGESPFFETPNLSFEGRVRNVARARRRTGAHRTRTEQRQRSTERDPAAADRAGAATAPAWRAGVRAWRHAAVTHPAPQRHRTHACGVGGHPRRRRLIHTGDSACRHATRSRVPWLWLRRTARILRQPRPSRARVARVVAALRRRAGRSRPCSNCAPSPRART